TSRIVEALASNAQKTSLPDPIGASINPRVKAGAKVLRKAVTRRGNRAPHAHSATTRAHAPAADHRALHPPAAPSRPSGQNLDSSQDSNPAPSLVSNLARNPDSSVVVRVPAVTAPVAASAARLRAQ